MDCARRQRSNETALEQEVAMAASRKLKTSLPVTEDSEPIECSSPPCYLHEFESGPPAEDQPNFRIKRIYDAPDVSDGFRVLVDRLWPRGVHKEQALLDAWARELAPSTALRQWFQHDPARWPEFQLRYRAELRDRQPELQVLRQRARRQAVTLLFAAKDPKINHAVALRAILLEH
jgi:uncharacterized protein YeaO (DUF488 family)